MKLFYKFLFQLIVLLLWIPKDTPLHLFLIFLRNSIEEMPNKIKSLVSNTHKCKGYAQEISFTLYFRAQKT